MARTLATKPDTDPASRPPSGPFHRSFEAVGFGAAGFATVFALARFPWSSPASAVWLWDTSGGSVAFTSWMIAVATSVGVAAVALVTLLVLRARIDLAAVAALGLAGGVLIPLVLAHFQISILAIVGLVLAPLAALVAHRWPRPAIAALVGHGVITAFTATRTAAACGYEDCFRSQPWSTGAGLALLWLASLQLQRRQAEAASSA